MATAKAKQAAMGANLFQFNTLFIVITFLSSVSPEWLRASIESSIRASVAALGSILFHESTIRLSYIEITA